jgi:hypothetical protein
MDQPFRDVTYTDVFYGAFMLYVIVLAVLVFRLNLDNALLIYMLASTVAIGVGSVVIEIFNRKQIQVVVYPIITGLASLHLVSLGYVLKDYEDSEIEWVFGLFVAIICLFATLTVYFQYK